MTRFTLALLLMTPIAIQAQAPAPPKLAFAFELHAEVAPPLVVGDVAAGTRRIVQITGGTFEGPGFKGRVLPGGADWQIIHPDGFSELDTRYTIQTDGGQTVYVQNAGIRHAAPDVMSDAPVSELPALKSNRSPPGAMSQYQLLIVAPPP